MQRKKYELIEKYMMSCMTDSAHDREHTYRVLYIALEIAKTEEHVDLDILIAACLLHDVGRKEQFANSKLNHAVVGAEKAYKFLMKNGYSVKFAQAVADCIKSHRYRSDNEPRSIEAKILFDADKIDVSGAIGIARTILYQGHMSQPLYTLNKNGEVSDGTGEKNPSFFREYKKKLEKIYSKFYTSKGTEIALQRQQAAITYYENLLNEVKQSYKAGAELLDKQLSEQKHN